MNIKNKIRLPIIISMIIGILLLIITIDYTFNKVLRKNEETSTRYILETTVGLWYQTQSQISNVSEYDGKTLFNQLYMFMYDNSGSDGSYAYIFDKTGHMLMYVDKHIIGTLPDLRDKKTGEPLLEQIIESGKTGEPFHYMYTKKGEGDKLYGKTGYVKSIYNGNQYVVFTTYDDTIESVIRNINTKMIVIGILLLSIIIILVSAISSGISKTIQQITNQISNMNNGSGDLTVTLKYDKKDEIGDLTYQINNLNAALHKTISTIVHNVDLLHNHYNDINLNILNSTSKVESISDNTSSIFDLSDILLNDMSVVSQYMDHMNEGIIDLDNIISEQASSVEETSAAITQMVASVNAISNAAIKKEASSQHLLTIAEDGREKLNTTTKIIKIINDSIDSITGMVGVITDISEQTNLLSMNAMIESAHAGEAGKGFAVVAGEIRKLADTSAKSAKHIGDSLKEVVSDIAKAKTSSEVTERSFNSIFNEIGHTANSFKEISIGAQELSAGTTQIAEATDNLQKISMSVSDSSISMKNEIDNVNKQVIVATDSTNKVIVDVNVIQDEITHLEKTMDSFKQSGEGLHNISEALSTESNKFKV